MNDPISVLHSIQASLIDGLISGREVVRSGNLLTLFSASDPLVYLNQTVPVGDVSSADLEQLEQACRERGRTPFFEFHEELWPQAAQTLADWGYQCTHRMPVMTMTAAQWTADGGDLALCEARIAKDADVAEMWRVGRAAFEPDTVVTDEELEKEQQRTERTIRQMRVGGALAAVGIADQQVISIGMAVGTPEIREIAGIATLPNFQRKGYATAVIRVLLDAFFSAGGKIAWLTPGDDGAQSLYAKLGFEPKATQVAYQRRPST